MPRASFSHTAELHRPASAVWAELQDAATWAGIGPVDEVWEPVVGDDGALARFRWSAHVGPTKHEGSAEVTVSNPPHHMKLNLDSSELAGSLIADIATGEAPQLVVTLEIISKGTMAALFFPLIAEAVGRGLPDQVESFAASLNGGAAGPDRLRPV